MFDIAFVIVFLMNLKHLTKKKKKKKKKKKEKAKNGFYLLLSQWQQGCFKKKKKNTWMFFWFTTFDTMNIIKSHAYSLAPMLQHVTIQREATHLKATYFHTSIRYFLYVFLLDLRSCWCWLGAHMVWTTAADTYPINTNTLLTCMFFLILYLSDMCLLASVYFWDGCIMLSTVSQMSIYFLPTGFILFL